MGDDLRGDGIDAEEPGRVGAVRRIGTGHADPVSG